MKNRSTLLAAIIVIIGLTACGKDKRSQLVNTWTFKKGQLNSVYTDLLKEYIDDEDSVKKIVSVLEAERANAQYTLREDGTATIKTASGTQEAKWVYSVHPEENDMESAIVRFTKDGKELETWQLYGNDMTLGHECGCYDGVLIASQDEMIGKLLDDPNIVFSGSLYPASKENLEQY